MTEVVFFHGVWLSLNCLAICIPIYKTSNAKSNFFLFLVRVFAFQIKFPPIDDETDRAISLAKKIFTYVMIFHVIMLATSYLFIYNK